MSNPKKRRVIWALCNKETGKVSSNIIAHTDAQRIALCVHPTEEIVKFMEVLK